MRHRSSGFTLIELLIVVVILGILAAIAIPKFSRTREKSFITAAKADLRNLASLQEVYYNDYYTFTSSLVDVGFDASDGVTITIPEATNRGWSATAVPRPSLRRPWRATSPVVCEPGGQDEFVAHSRSMTDAS
jgi:type IV pilus assembly protein PilA